MPDPNDPQIAGSASSLKDNLFRMRSTTMIDTAMDSASSYSGLDAQAAR